MRVELLMSFRSRNYIGTRGEDLSTVKVLLIKTPYVFATNRSKKVVCDNSYFVGLCCCFFL